MIENFYKSLDILQEFVDKYINFYNTERSHQRLGMKTPNQLEKEYFDNLPK